MWLVFSGLAAFVYAIGNSVYGAELSQFGLLGIAFLGPIGTIVTGIWKIYDMISVSRKHNKPIFDKSTSNYYKRVQIDLPNENQRLQQPLINSDAQDTEAGAEDAVYEYRLNWSNVYFMLTQALPNLIGLILVTFAFKFAAIAEINNGCIPSLFSICSIYIAVLFYY